jgi:outer membrane protein TolC
VLALGFAAPASAQTEAAAADVLTLDDAVTLALQNNRNVGIAALQVQRAEKKIEAGKTRRLPSMDLQLTAGTTLNTVKVSFPEGAFGHYPIIGPIPAANTIVEAPKTVTGNINASISQPLSQLYKIGLSTKLNELGRDVEKEKLRDERAGIAAEVRSLYYQLLQAESAVEAREEQVRVYRELDRVVGQQVALEIALRSDGLDVKSRLRNAEYELLGLQDDLATGRQRMNSYLGRDLDHPFRLVAVPEAKLEEVDLTAAVARAVEHRPDLAQARIAIQQADTDRRLKKAEWIPDVSLSVTYYSFVNIDLLPRNVAIAGLQLKWEPFDWGRRGKEKAEKELQLEQTKTRARDAEDLVKIEVAQRFRKLQEARLLVEAQRLGREAAAEKLRIVTSRHKQDAALLKDLLEAEASMGGAQTDYDRALSTFWTARADLQKALGEEL